MTRLIGAGRHQQMLREAQKQGAIFKALGPLAPPDEQPASRQVERRWARKAVKASRGVAEHLGSD